ncbi:hypothetical protein AAVH_40249, partial [Aphelenchoides avenae]
ELVQDLIKDIEERQAWLELGDKDPSVLKRVDLAKQVDRISSKVSLPKSTIENILKESDAGGKAGPSKQARYSPYSTNRRPGSTQPFRQGGAGNEGLAAAAEAIGSLFNKMHRGYSGPSSFNMGPNYQSPGTKRAARKTPGPCWICGEV